MPEPLPVTDGETCRGSSMLLKKNCVKDISGNALRSLLNRMDPAPGWQNGFGQRYFLRGFLLPDLLVIGYGQSRCSLRPPFKWSRGGSERLGQKRRKSKRMGNVFLKPLCLFRK